MKIMKRSLKVYDDVAKGSTNRFSNSQVHRQRHRLIQTVLLLQAFIAKVFTGIIIFTECNNQLGDLFFLGHGEERWCKVSASPVRGH
jgi:hypothetical protein